MHSNHFVMSSVNLPIVKAELGNMKAPWSTTDGENEVW